MQKPAIIGGPEGRRSFWDHADSCSIAMQKIIKSRLQSDLLFNLNGL